jgi:nicastrin
MDKIHFPVFAINETDGEDLLNKAKENKRLNSWPKWAVEFKAFMWGSVNSATCLRRGYCEPVGGQSVWGTFEEGLDDQREIVLVMAQLDANSIFQDLAIGAEAASSGVTTLLTAIQALASQRKKEVQLNIPYAPPAPTKRQLVFGFWTGEDFGYIGSRSFVQDLVNFKCNSPVTGDQGRVRCSNPWASDYAFKNISFSRIYAMIDLQQLGQIEGGTVYVHRAPTSKNTDVLMATLNASASGLRVSVEPAFQPTFELPPSSLQSFLLANDSLPAIMLSDFKSNYRNPYFGSRWDNWDNVRAESICTAAGLVARALYTMLYDANPPPELQANCDLVSELLDCFVRNNSCGMKRGLLGVVEAPNPPTNYVGLYRSDRAAYNLNVLLVNQVLNWLTSPQYYMPQDLTVNCTSASQCPPGQNMACIGGTCRNSSVFLHDAAPMGSFKWDTNWGGWTYSNQLYLSRYQQPLWTEPTWDVPSLRVFRKEQFLIEALSLALGVTELVVAFGVCWMGRKYLNSRFGAGSSVSQ